MKIAIVGCGMVAESHVRIIKQLKISDELYLCDTNRTRAEALKATFGARAIYSNIDELLSKQSPDILHVLTPPSTHACLSEKGILAGCHVLVEKPATETLIDLYKILKLAREREKIFFVNYSTLGIPIVLQARNIIASKKLGRLIAVHCNYACSWPSNSIPYGDPYHWSYSLRGGILQNWIDHPASLILDVLDSFDEQRILLLSRNILPYDCSDLLHVVVRNKDQIGSFTLSLGHGNTDIRAHFILENGSLIVDLRRMLISRMKGKGPQNIIKRAKSGIIEGYSFAGGTIKNIFHVMFGKLRREPGIYNMICNFYDMIHSGAEPLVKPSTVVSVTKIVEAICKEINKN